MFNELVSAIKNLFSSVRPWVLVAPWEQCLRVRLGKWVKLLHAGPHWRIPLMDRIYLQSVRLRISVIDRQTVTTKDGRTVTLAGQIGYALDDIKLLYSTLHHAEDTIRNMAKSLIADYVYRHDLADCAPLEIETAVMAGLSLNRYGLLLDSMKITDFAVTRAYRIMGDYGNGACGTLLSTEAGVGT